MSDLCKRLNKITQLADNVARETGDALSDMRKLIDSIKKSENELADIDYDGYTKLEKDFENFEMNLKEIERYLSIFAREPGFEITEN